MDDQPAPVQQRFFLAGFEPHVFDLIRLGAQEGFFPSRVLELLPEVAHSLPGVRERREALLHGGCLGLEAAVGVEQGEVGFGAQQRVLLVLPVDVMRPAPISDRSVRGVRPPLR